MVQAMLPGEGVRFPPHPALAPSDMRVGIRRWRMREKYRSKDFLCLTLLSLLHPGPGSQVLLATTTPQLPQVPNYCPSPRLPYLRLGPFPPSSREIRSPPEPCSSGHLQQGLPSHLLQFLSTFYLMLRFSGTNLISSTRLSAPGVRIHVEFIFVSSAVPGTVSHSGGYLILIE